MPQISNKDTQVRPPGEQPIGSESVGRGPRPQQGAQRYAHETEASPVPAQQGTDRAGTSFAARFGRLILSHGIAALPSALYHYQGRLKLSAQQVWFVCYVLSHKWDEDLPYPSLKKMEKCTGISERHLRRMKSELCQKGLLQVYPRYGERERRDTDAYDFSGLFAKLEKVLSSEPTPANVIRVESPGPNAAELGQVDSSFVARFGRVIARFGVTAVPRAIFTHQAALGLTPQQVWFVSYIFSFQWDTALPYPSIRRMATVTGYSSVQLHNIKAELVKAGYLSLVRRNDNQGGQDTNAYDFSGILEAIRTLLQGELSSTNPVEIVKPSAEPEVEEEEPRRRGRKPKADKENSALGLQTPVSWEGDTELPAPGDLQLTGVGDTELSGDTDTQFTGVEDRYLSGAPDSGFRGAGKHTPAGGVTPALPGTRTRGLHEIEEDQIEKNKNDDSNQRAQYENFEPKKQNQNRASIPGYSPYVAAVISDFSQELGDMLHNASNMKQALNLWQSSGIKEDDFVEMMHEARRLTRKYQSRPTWDSMGNKMAYFFTCLRSLVAGPPPEEN